MKMMAGAMGITFRTSHLLMFQFHQSHEQIAFGFKPGLLDGTTLFASRFVARMQDEILRNKLDMFWIGDRALVCLIDIVFDGFHRYSK